MIVQYHEGEPCQPDMRNLLVSCDEIGALLKVLFDIDMAIISAALLALHYGRLIFPTPIDI